MVSAEVLDREPTLSEPVAGDFTARWLDLPKSVDQRGISSHELRR